MRGPPSQCWLGGLRVLLICGGVLFSRTLWSGVSSPLQGLASRFGMELGVSLALCPPQKMLFTHYPPTKTGLGALPGLWVFCLLVWQPQADSLCLWGYHFLCVWIISEFA